MLNVYACNLNKHIYKSVKVVSERNFSQNGFKRASSY